MSFSIWQLLLVLGWIAVPAVTIATEKSGQRIQRKEYFGWFVIAVLVNLAASVAMGVFDNLFGMVIGLALTTLIYIVLLRKTVQRARDAGIAKGYCYLTIVPIANLIFIIVLFFSPTVGPRQDAGTAA